MISAQIEVQGSAVSPCGQSAWFNAHVLPLAGELRGWLGHRYPNAPDHEDIVQEAYIRLLRARNRSPVRNVRSLLYTTARNLAIDNIRRQMRSPIQDITADRAHAVPALPPDPADTSDRQWQLRLLALAIHQLPPRCRQTLEFTSFQGLSTRETGERMGVAASTVQNHLATAIRLCIQYFYEQGALDRPPPPRKKSTRQPKVHLPWVAAFQRELTRACA